MRATDAKQIEAARVALLAELLEANFGWTTDAGWEATAASMLAKVDALPQIAAIATDGLAGKVAALADEWESWSEGRSTPRIDAFKDAAEALRALLSDPASEEESS